MSKPEKLEVIDNQDFAAVASDEAARSAKFPGFDRAAVLARAEIERRHLKLVGIVVKGNYLYAEGSLGRQVLSTIHYKII